VVLDTAGSGVVAALRAGGEPEGMTISPDGAIVYATSERDNLVSVLDTRSNKVIHQIAVWNTASRVGVFARRRRAYVTSEVDANVTVIDVHHRKFSIRSTFPGADSSGGRGVANDGKTVYVATVAAQRW